MSTFFIESDISNQTIGVQDRLHNPIKAITNMKFKTWLWLPDLTTTEPQNQAVTDLGSLSLNLIYCRYIIGVFLSNINYVFYLNTSFTQLDIHNLVLFVCEWVSGYCFTPNKQLFSCIKVRTSYICFTHNKQLFSRIKARTCYIWRDDDSDDVRFVLCPHTELDLIVLTDIFRG